MEKTTLRLRKYKKSEGKDGDGWREDEMKMKSVFMKRMGGRESEAAGRSGSVLAIGIAITYDQGLKNVFDPGP